MTPNLELAKVRDFGEIIGDSFLFVRQNFKPLLRTFFTFCGFFILASTVTAIIQQLSLHSMVGVASGDYDDTVSRVSRFGLTAIVNFIFLALSYTSIAVTILCYMVIYKEKGNVPPTNEEVWGYFKYYFFKILGSAFLNVIILVIGFMFCLIPGIWLYPILSLTVAIIIMENTSYGYAFNQSFRLIKENWWTTFGALVIMSIIIAIAAAIVTVPAAIWNQFSLLLHWPGGNIAAVLTAVLGNIALVLHIVPVVTLALCYFSLNEGKEGTGLMERINRIGEKDDQSNLPAEEY